MNSRPGILITKPISLLNKPINVNFPSFFTGLAKVVANATVANWGNVPENIVDVGAAIGLAKEPGEIAWLLIFRSLTQAMVSLLEDNQDLLKQPNKVQQVDTNELEVIAKYRLNQSLIKLHNTEITIYQDFFEHPQDLLIVQAIKTPFTDLLQSFNLNKAQAEAISQRLPIQFVYALHEEWVNNSDKYARLQAQLDSPFIKTVEREAKRELSWRRYSTWLENQINQRMFFEAFSLKQVYVPLRAYYEEREDEEKHRKIQRIVVDLETELQTWLNQADEKDAIRVISGGPGSGKSSFGKIFAAKQAKIFAAKNTTKVKIPVLFIPLHLFNPEDDLINSIGKFIKSMRDVPLPLNPLEPDNFVERLLIIFDGLDELAMQGKIAEDVAQKFVNEVERQVNSFNQQKTRLQVIISGRELVVQKNSSDFRKPKQILHILPYFVPESERDNYDDAHKLLNEDQRQRWWKSYGEASGCGYIGLPEDLDKGNLREITSQPLLNYLVALSYKQGKLEFSQDSNLNEIYADLLTQVYQRLWADDNPHIKGIAEKEFVRVLEGIAIAAWHGGDGRTTTVKEIESHCDENILKRVLDVFKQQDAKAAVTRLLTAFYFRSSGYKQNEETFEFTHKSFGEYLTAKRIVREVLLIDEKLKNNEKDSDDGWNKQEALRRWAKLCGATAMDEYLFSFVVDEIRLQQDKDKVDVGEWQQTLCQLISYMLREGMPMELLPEIKTFHQANQQARNAEEALLAVLNACARVTKNISQIEWHSPETFGTWISRLQGQRVNPIVDVFCLNCLSFLDLRNCVLVLKDFYGANLEEANLEEANLEEANLQRANLQWANLQGAILQRAILQRANLQRANLQRANLQWANLQGANLQRAILQRANLQGAILEGAILQRANLQGAILEGKDLTALNQDSNSDFNNAEIQ